mgnify:CR=1 FL=1
MRNMSSEAPWAPGCLLGASWVPPGCLLGASSVAILAQAILVREDAPRKHYTTCLGSRAGALGGGASLCASSIAFLFLHCAFPIYFAMMFLEQLRYKQPGHPVQVLQGQQGCHPVQELQGQQGCHPVQVHQGQQGCQVNIH